MQALLNRSNTATTISSFWCSPSPPSSRPPPPLNYEHIESSPPSAFQKIAYPRSRSADLRASKLGLVEKMSSKERMEKWNETREEETPLEKWRREVAKEVGEEMRRENEREREKEEQERVVSWKPSVVTTSSMRSATKGLKDQFDLSSPFARSFAVESLKTPLTADSNPTSSIVRESFMNETRKNVDEHPYSQALSPDHDQRPQLIIATSTSLVPPAPETSASVSPIDPAFSTPATPYRFPLLSDQRHPLPLPRLDTNTPISIASTSPVSAPVLTSYQSIPRPPRSSSLPFCDLESLPPTPPPKPSPYELLPPKAAALLGLIPTSHSAPKPSFARDRERKDSLASTNSTEQYRSSFYTDYDGPLTRPSCDSTTPTSLNTPSSLHRKNESSSTSPHKNRSRPPPLTLRKEGMSSLPDLSSSLSTPSLFRTSLDTPRHYAHRIPAHTRSHTFAETEIESLLDAPMHSHPPLPSPPFPLPSTRFGQSIGQDLGRRTKEERGGGLGRSLSRGKGLVRKMSGSLGRQNTSERERVVSKRKSLKDLKKGFERVEKGFRYW